MTSLNSVIDCDILHSSSIEKMLRRISPTLKYATFSATEFKKYVELRTGVPNHLLIILLLLESSLSFDYFSLVYTQFHNNSAFHKWDPLQKYKGK